MSKKYYAIPVLIYVPVENLEPFDAELQVAHLLNQSENLKFFLAEDFQTSIQEETDDNDLSGMIETACVKVD